MSEPEETHLTVPANSIHTLSIAWEMVDRLARLPFGEPAMGRVYADTLDVTIHPERLTREARAALMRAHLLIVQQEIASLEKVAARAERALDAYERG